MKKVIFVAIFCAGSAVLFAQNHKQDNRKAPESVRRSYQKDHPDYKDDNSTWDMKNNQWHTRYMDKDHGNRPVDVYYDRTGRRLQSRGEWDRNDLPDAVKNRMTKRYHAENYNAYRIEKPGRGIYFQITWGTNKKVYVDEHGREVKY